jgi:predicted nuclease with TOPRIM domain
VSQGLKRRSQNREAQRRFRERKEQEKAELTKRLRGLGAELRSARQKVNALEAENERLVMELDVIRPWHRSFMSIMLAFPGLEPTTTTNLMLCDKP